MVVCMSKATDTLLCANSAQVQEFDSLGLVEELAWDAAASASTGANHLCTLASCDAGAVLVSGHWDANRRQSFLKVWNRDSWQCWDTIEIGSAKVLDVSISPDARWLHYATQEEVGVWCCASREAVVQHPPLFGGGVACFCICDGFLAYGSAATPGEEGDTAVEGKTGGGSASQVAFCRLSLASLSDT